MFCTTEPEIHYLPRTPQRWKCAFQQCSPPYLRLRVLMRNPDQRSGRTLTSDAVPLALAGYSTTGRTLLEARKRRTDPAEGINHLPSPSQKLPFLSSNERMLPASVLLQRLRMWLARLGRKIALLFL